MKKNNPYTFKEVKNKKSWEKFILANNPKSFLQSWNWGETNKILGEKVLRLGIFNKSGKMVGAAQLVKQEAKRGWHFLLPGGPVLDWGNSQLISLFINELKEIAKKEKVNFIRLRPEIIDNGANRILFKSLGFVESPMHLHAQNTWLLDITKTEEELLKNMRKSTRYLIKKSLNEKLKIIKSINAKDAVYIKELQDEVVERSRFVGFSQKYFEAQISTFGPDNEAKIYLVKHKGSVVVAAIVIFYGERAYYHNSGSNIDGLKVNASYRFMWEVIKDAKARGLQYYDMWGAIPPGRKNHRFAGPSLFKEGFGGDRIDWLPAQDLPINLKYWGTHLFEKGRKLIRGL